MKKRDASIGGTTTAHMLQGANGKIYSGKGEGNEIFVGIEGGGRADITENEGSLQINENSIEEEGGQNYYQNQNSDASYE